MPLALRARNPPSPTRRERTGRTQPKLRRIGGRSKDDVSLMPERPGPGGATARDDRKMNNEPLEREPIDRVRARLEALLKANAAPRCGARSKRTGKPCQGAAMPNGRCKL